MMDKIEALAEKHPLATGAIVFVGGLVLLYLLGYLGSAGSSSTSSNPGNGAAAFYQAEAAQTASGNALQAAQLQTAAAVAINGQNTQAYTAAQKVWANTSLGQTSMNAKTAQAQAADAANVAITQSNNQLLAQQAVTSAHVYDTAVAHGANVWSRVNSTGGSINVNQNAVAANPASLRGAGFSSSEIAAILASHPNPNAVGNFH